MSEVTLGLAAVVTYPSGLLLWVGSVERAVENATGHDCISVAGLIVGETMLFLGIHLIQRLRKLLIANHHRRP